jgi:transcriptional regulator with XRE-family HTH domain
VSLVVAVDAALLATRRISEAISVSKGRPTIIVGMPNRHRLTDLEREVLRRSSAIALSLGQEVRAGRARLSMTQRAASAKVGISQTAWSRIERGLGGQVPLQTWIALGIALGRPLAIAFSRPIGEPRGPVDAGHLEIQEHVLRLARATGRHGTFELPTRPGEPARSTDVGLRDDVHRVLIQVECWNTFGDLGAAIRATNRKTVEAAHYAIATGTGDVEAHRVATVWIVRSSAGNRALLARYRHIIDAAFPGSSRRWCRALTQGAEPPAEPGIVWFDPATHRLTEHRRAR